MNLIFVHGRAQEGKDPVTLAASWKGALEKGLSKAGLKLPADTQVNFPYYGDKLDELIKQLDAPLVADVATKGGPNPDAELNFRFSLLEELREAQGITDQEVMDALPPGPQEKGPLNWKWVHAVLKVLDKTKLGGKALDTFTRDVYVYLCYPTVAQALHNIVEPYIKAGPCVVVGHSLGSVVAYNALRRCPSAAVSRYVTVGSPLGVMAVKKKLAMPLSMPTCTNSWFNARDPHDLVALHPLDTTHFGITPAISNKNDVHNWTDNQHGIDGYLDDPVVASQIYGGLTGG